MIDHVSDIEVEGKNFRVFDNRLDATPIVFLHGNSGCWQHWNPQIEYFQDKYRVVAFDQIGYGESSALTSDYTMMRQFEDTRALLYSLNIDRCHIVGLSMGGACAQLFGLHSEIPLSLCLAGIFRYDDMHPAVTERYQEIAEMAKENPNPGRDFFAKMSFGEDFIKSSPDQVDDILSGFFKTDVVVASVLAAPESLAEIGKVPVSEIEVPCLVVAGDEDTMAPQIAVRELFNALPNAQWRLLERSGHMLNVERPQEFNEALSNFLHGINLTENTP